MVSVAVSQTRPPPLPPFLPAADFPFTIGESPLVPPEPSILASLPMYTDGATVFLQALTSFGTVVSEAPWPPSALCEAPAPAQWLERLGIFPGP